MTIDSINSPGTKIPSTNQSTNNNSTATRVDATFYRQLKPWWAAPTPQLIITPDQSVPVNL